MPNLIAAGHGRPMAGAEAAAGLQDLAGHFDEWERPHRGRYARVPAETGERGVVRLPPVVPPAAKIGIVAGLAATLVVAAARRRCRG